MVNSYVVYDCVLGDEVIFVNGVFLVGYVMVGRGVIFVGMGGIVQFVRVGEYVYVGGVMVVSRDVLLYSMVKGYRGRMVGVNVVGLKRRGWMGERIQWVERVVRVVLRGDQEELSELVKRVGSIGKDDLMRVVDFVRELEIGMCLLYRKVSGGVKL